MIQVVIPEDALAALVTNDVEEPEQDQDLNVEVAPQGEVEAAKFQEDKETPNTEPAADTPDAVPYSRFTEVIAAKNAAKAEADHLKRELEELRAGIFEDPSDEVEEGTDYSLESRLQRIELAEATKTLDAEVAAARQAHPEVPESVLYKAVTEDPSIDVLVVAKSYSNHVDGIKKRAVEDYLATLPAEQKVPPKLKTSGSAGRQTKKPKTLAEAHKAMREAVRTADW